MRLHGGKLQANVVALSAAAAAASSSRQLLASDMRHTAAASNWACYVLCALRHIRPLAGQAPALLQLALAGCYILPPPRCA